MGSKKNLKEVFEAENKYGAFFTGGVLQWTQDGSTILSQCDGSIKVLNVAKGLVISTLNEDEEDAEKDIIYTFALGCNDETLVTSHKSGLFRLWSWTEGAVLKTWKSVHQGPIASLGLNTACDMLVSGGSDSGVRLWNIVQNTCTASLKGSQGVVSIVCFHPSDDVPFVFASADDCIIRGWNVNTRELEVTLSGHFSRVTSILFHRDNKHVVSCGRDKVIILWQMQKSEAVRTVPVYESLEGMVLLPDVFSLPDKRAKIEPGTLHVAVAGEKGVVHVWDLLGGREIFVQQNSLVSEATEEGGLAVTHLLFNEKENTLAVVSADHNIIMHHLDTFAVAKQLVGFSDEILDMVFVGENNSHLAVATNSIDIKLFNLADMGCQLIKGHTALVMALAATPSNPDLLLSCGKDKSVRAWLLDKDTQKMNLVGEGTRHTNSVGSVAISQLSTSFFLSVSQDMCIKLWTFPKKFEPDCITSLTVAATQLAHEKDINSVCISPNDKLVATGSQDKTAKLWSAEDLSLLGVLRGHRRGVWMVRFSPVDQVLLTASGDSTMKMWSLGDLSCVKTLEGHDASVLRGEFVSRGLQIVSAGADGFLKLWNIKTSECVCTMDGHEGKVWALAVSNDENTLVSGGSDSLLVRWRDMTEERKIQKLQEEEKMLLQEQELANLVHDERLLEALQLALTLDRPLKVLRIIQDIMKKGGTGLVDTIRKLRSDQKETLLKCAVNWNTNSKNSHPAQLVMSVLIGDISSGEMKVENFIGLVEGAIPYTERHFKRLTKLLQQVHLLNYTLKCMQPHAGAPNM